MSRWGRQAAMIWEGAEISYESLVEDVRQWSVVLERSAIGAGECVAVLGDYSPETCALLFALIANRNIVIPLSLAPGSRRDECLRVAQAGAVFEFKGRRYRGLTRRPWVSPEHELIQALRTRSSPGLILFSSGSSGASKAVLLDLGKLLTKYQDPRPAYRTLAFLLIDHIGGLNTLFSVFSQGGTIVPSGGRDPESVCRAIAQYRVDLLPTTPTFLNMLLISEAYIRHDISSLRLITFGTEPMPSSTLRHLLEVLPGVELKQTYGLSELGILRTKSRWSGSPWMKMGGEGYETKVVDHVLWIRSDSAMLGYLNTATPFDADGWFPTGDLVEVDGDWLRVLGRKSELINVGGEKVHPTEVESVLLEMDNVRDASVSGRPNPVTGQVVAARLTLREPEGLAELHRRVRRYCRDRLAPYKVPAVLEIADGELHNDRFKKVRDRG